MSQVLNNMIVNLGSLKDALAHANYCLHMNGNTNRCDSSVTVTEGNTINTMISYQGYQIFLTNVQRGDETTRHNATLNSCLIFNDLILDEDECRHLYKLVKYLSGEHVVDAPQYDIIRQESDANGIISTWVQYMGFEVRMAVIEPERWRNECYHLPRLGQYTYRSGSNAHNEDVFVIITRTGENN
jgi:hypothetical protein